MVVKKVIIGLFLISFTSFIGCDKGKKMFGEAKMKREVEKANNRGDFDEGRRLINRHYGPDSDYECPSCGYGVGKLAEECPSCGDVFNIENAYYPDGRIKQGGRWHIPIPRR